MKLTKETLKKIINEEHRKLQESMYSHAETDYEKLMEKAVQACKDAGLSEKEIRILFEYELEGGYM